MSTFIRAMFGPGGWLGDGRYYVFAVLLPLACLAPWGIVTEAAPDHLTKGQHWGVFSPVPIELKPFDPRNLPEKIAVEEHINRLFSVATAILLGIISISVTVLGLMTACREIATAKDRIVFGGVWLVLVAGLLVLMDPSQHGARIMALLGKDVFENTVRAIYDGKPYELLKSMLMAANVIVVIGGATLAVAVTTLAASASRLQGPSDLPALQRLRHRLDLILIAAALVLGVGLIDMKSWQAWPLPFVVNVEPYQKLTNAFVAFQSVCYVGVLAALYLPTALVLDAALARIRRNAIAQATGIPAAVAPANDSRAGAEAGSLSSAGSPFAVLMRTVTVLSPVLVGPVATILQLKLLPA